MKNVFYALLCSASLVLFGSNDVYASEEPIYSVRAAIVGIENSCTTVRVDVVLKNEWYEIIMASATVIPDGQKSSPRSSNEASFIFKELKGYQKSIYEYYGGHSEITAAINEILFQFNKEETINEAFTDKNLEMLAYFERGGNILNLNIPKLADEYVKVSIQNFNGQILAIYPKIKIDNEVAKIYAAGFSNGAYTVSVATLDGKSISQSVLKR